MASLTFRFPVDALLATLSGWPRRLAALACLVLAALTAVTSHGSSAEPRRLPIVLSARALAPGTVLAAADLLAASWPVSDIPAAAVLRPAEAVGRAIGARMTRGEPVTSARLLDTGISAALAPGQVAITVALTSDSQAAILQAGALVDLYLGGTDLVAGSSVAATGAGSRLASAVRVLAVLPSSGGISGNSGPSLVVAADRLSATKLAAYPEGPFLATLVPP